MFGLDDLAIGSLGIGAAGSLAGILGIGGPGEYKAPSFADIDLSTANPELWKELQKVSAQADEAQKLYQARQQGMNYSEKAGLESSLQGVAQRQASMGQLGSAVGNSQMVDAEARIRSSLAQRAFQEQQALQQNAMSQRSQYAQQVLGAQQAVLNPQIQAAQMNYQNDQAESQARNGFFGGLVNSGLGALAQSNNANALQNYRAQNPSPYSVGIPSFYTPAYRGY